MATYEDVISISQLLLDFQNPRLPETQFSQHDAIRAMAFAQTEKILALAQHIVENGTNPANLPIVMPSDSEGMFFVLDGNRRVTALKLLESPLLAEGIFNKSSLEKLKKLSVKFVKNPITKLNCIVVTDRKQADLWIQLIHRGQNDGAGLVPWDGQVAARYDARKTGSKSSALQVLDFVKENATLAEDTQKSIVSGKFPITSLERLIQTPYVRKKLGIDLQDGTIKITFPHDEILKGLSRIVDDLGTGHVTVSDIKRQDQRIDYMNSFEKNELPDDSTELDTPLPLELPITERKFDANPKKAGGKSKNRSTLIPKECKLVIAGESLHRINNIYLELKKIAIDEFPNSCAVMMRVFIELSTDHFLLEKQIMQELQIDNTSLALKIKSVADYFEQNKLMNKNQLATVKKLSSGQSMFVASTKSLNSFVHNPYYSPVASELKIGWDDLQLFFEKIWSA